MPGIYPPPSPSSGPLWLSSAVNVDLDPTFFIHFILFGAFVVIMKDLIFDPMIKVFERREQMTSGEIDEARAMDERAIERKAELDGKLDRIRRDAAADREEVRARVQRLEGALLAEARETMSEKLDEGMARLRDDVTEIETELEAERGPLAATIASRVLGREVRAPKGAPSASEARR
ncbi:MAG: ATP synthase F0 subunit B [Myxococcota bacterium]